MNKFIIFGINLILLFLSQNGFSQNEFSKWYFGAQAGLDFSTNPPTALNNGAMTANEGCAAISDNVGNLLFYTNGIQVYNNTHTLMANGQSLFRDGSSSQAALIVKQPGNNNNYFILTTGGNSFYGYSIVDMNLAAGLGSVTTKNYSLYTPTCEKQVAVRHCNGKDIWLLSHKYNSSSFYAYLLTSAGMSTTPVTSTVPLIENLPWGTGQLKISPDGRKLAMTMTALSNTQLANYGYHLLDFDPSTGIVSNPNTLLNVAGAYGIEFSPDGSKLYGSNWGSHVLITPTLYEWNLCAGNSTLISNSVYSVTLGSPSGNIALGSLQKAIDGKIYLAVMDFSLNLQTMGVIHNPNLMGSASNFTINGLSIAPKHNLAGLPNYINNYTKPVPATFTNSIACQTASFAVPPTPTLSGGCSSAAPSAPIGYLWDFGEPTSGVANSSTLTNPSHLYANTGTYTVSLILFNNCTNDTIRQVVNIATVGPKPDVAGTFTICKGEKPTYTVSGGSSYQWFNNATTSTISLSPTTNTVYSVKSTSNGCTSSKSFSVTVNPCLGLSNVSSSAVENQINFFPNPVNNELTASTVIAGHLSIFDMSGRIVLKRKIEAGENKISTANLKAGVYVIEVAGLPLDFARGDSGVWHGRLVKIE
jgi:PKD repeat protein